MSESTTDLGAQAISKVAEMGITSQLDEVDELKVDVQTDPLKAVQGKIDSLSIEGTGMVIKEELRVEKMQLQTDAVSINPLKLAFGQVELLHPTTATTEVVLTESDLNRAFNSDFIRKKLQDKLSLSLDETTGILEAQEIEFSLPEEDRIFISSKFSDAGTGNIYPVSFTAKPQISADKQQVTLEKIQYGEEKDTHPELTGMLIEQAHELLNLANFELDGMELYLTDLKIKFGKMLLICQAEIEQFAT
ncbi:MAG: hypothetical protein N5P05_003945 [Chroococcopsis gigantea SAG 12.99]|jgi:hypothetical protein|nr:DUF2993 domain-containing protein [Chlorogloea purpurea SAG 13.99]MDV3002339.1 hypothetical protein [Chroococcopsis gigantea SAG 12.99]